ncbi:LacI family DNA-binding transcriptional regulator [Solicola sp. PLA-1-18]|uniref:LacI family DNA-binding transcriptional regulator n=1 Tax=Solicola sp. PLA-1-18 TaxID=3380532 RepID=UPI003B7D6EDA
MQRRSVTMREVAVHAGVSTKTVSRVVNGEANVSPSVVARVTASLASLDYRPNIAAGSLRRGQTRSIGVLLQDVANDYSAGVLRAIDDVGVREGIAVFVASLDEEPDRERELAASLVSRRVDGLVLMPATDDQSYLGSDLERGLAVVVVDREPCNLGVDAVLTDSFGGARAAVHHLVDHGHRRIGLLVDSAGLWTSDQRRAGYAAALRERGLEVDERLVRVGVRSAEQAARATVDLLGGDAPPTALFAGRNVFAEGAVRALRRLDLTRSVALVGFDDFPLADLLDPGVTVVHQSTGAIGRTAAEYLVGRVRGHDGPPRHTVLPTTIVARGSGEIPAHRTGRD